MKYLPSFFMCCYIFFTALLASCSTKTDIEKEKLSIINADKAFSQYSADSGQIKSFLAYADENATLLRPNSMPIAGKKEIEKLYSSKSDTSYSLTWSPLYANVGESADIGYSYGTWILISKNEEDRETKSEGTYATVWKKQTDGTWKWVLDTGNEGLKRPATSESQKKQQ